MLNLDELGEEIENRIKDAEKTIASIKGVNESSAMLSFLKDIKESANGSGDIQQVINNIKRYADNRP